MDKKITPFLWYESQAEEAADFYTSLFPDSRVLNKTSYDESSAKMSGKTPGSIMTVAFELFGQLFTAINGGPPFKFSEAISFVVNCDTQEEVDKYWQALSSDPSSEQCGWLKDKFGLSWQIIPKELPELLAKDQSGKVMQAMLKMKKINIKELREAANS